MKADRDSPTALESPPPDPAPALQARFELSLPGYRLQAELQAGRELVAMFGPSGAGKSMTLRALAGLVRPDSGHIRINGQPVFDSRAGIDLPPQLRRIGYVPQDYALFPHRTIAENIAYGLHGLPFRVQHGRVAELLELMRLEGQAGRRPGEVSGGQQQRTALARALAIRPRVLLMDEPFAALEEELRMHLRDELRRVQQRYQIPIVLVTHSLTEAYSLADQLVVLDGGRVIQAGPREEVYRRPHTPKVAALMGMTNILQVSVLADSLQSLTALWKGNQLAIARPVQFGSNQQLQLGLRPEEIQIHPKAAIQGEAGDNLLRGVVLEDQALGTHHLLRVAVGDSAHEPAALQVLVPSSIIMESRLAVGQECGVAIKASSFHVFPVSSPAEIRIPAPPQTRLPAQP